MIENHKSFNFRGQVVHNDLVLFVYDEGIYAQYQTKAPAVHAGVTGLGATDNPGRAALRAKLATLKWGGWIEGWHPAVGRPSWGNAPAAEVMARCDDSRPLEVGWLGTAWDFDPASRDCVFVPYRPGDDMMFVWYVPTAPTRCVIIPRPMLAPGNPGFDPAFNAASGEKVLSTGVLAPNRYWAQIPYADLYTLEGYQIEEAGKPPNLFLNGGVLIQTHANGTIHGFHPWPDAFCAIARDEEDLHRLAASMSEPRVAVTWQGKMKAVTNDVVPPGACMVLVDSTSDGYQLTPLHGYVPLKLPDGRPNPAADPAITTAKAHVALTDASYALDVDPRRVKRMPQVDAGSLWEIDEIAALTKACLCNHLLHPIKYGIGHDYLMPMIEHYLSDPKLSPMLGLRKSQKDIDAELVQFHADKSMRDWMLLRLDTPTLLALLPTCELKALSTSKLADHPKPFVNGEFKNAIVIATDPASFRPSLPFTPTEAMQSRLSDQDSRRRYATFNSGSPIPSWFPPDKPERTTMYFTPDGECLPPGSRGCALDNPFRTRANPLVDGGWREVEVIQL